MPFVSVPRSKWLSVCVCVCVCLGEGPQAALGDCRSPKLVYSPRDGRATVFVVVCCCCFD